MAAPIDGFIVDEFPIREYFYTFPIRNDEEYLQYLRWSISLQKEEKLDMVVIGEINRRILCYEHQIRKRVLYICPIFKTKQNDKRTKSKVFGRPV